MAAGSSISGAEPRVAEFLAAASGPIIVALQIAYLPTLYAAYNRRETVVTLLSPRAGSPAWGPRKLTRTLRIPVDEDPRPDGPVQLSWEEYLQGRERITSAGFRVERTAEEAWPHFRGWRINYEAAAYKLASGLDAVPVPWSGPRRHSWSPFEPRRLANRTPEHPDGQPDLTPGTRQG